MAKEKFEDWNPTGKSLRLLSICDEIITDYSNRGYDLSLRQLYYQLVSKNLIPNDDKEYKRMGNLIKRGRMAGLIDWEAINDRVRHTMQVPTWVNGASIIRSAYRSFKIDMWDRQPEYIEVMCEKDALSGVLETVCRRYRVPYTANRGYSSTSHLYRIGERLWDKGQHNKAITILYFGDHDPSGMDMDRDIETRLSIFSQWTEFDVVRVALLRDQVDRWNILPNPAKLKDTRAPEYIAEHGMISWELDAIDPDELVKIVEDWVAVRIDWDQWKEDQERENRTIAKLKEYADEWVEP